MLDAKMVVGAVLTAAAYSSTWVEQANEYASLVLSVGGILVAIVTIIYTVLRIRQIRKSK